MQRGTGFYGNAPCGQLLSQPIGWPSFCSSSHLSRGSKYSTKGSADIWRDPVIASSASCHGMDEAPASSCHYQLIHVHYFKLTLEVIESVRCLLLRVDDMGRVPNELSCLPWSVDVASVEGTIVGWRLHRVISGTGIEECGWQNTCKHKTRRHICIYEKSFEQLNKDLYGSPEVTLLSDRM